MEPTLMPEIDLDPCATHDFVDGIDMAAIVRQRRNAGTVDAMLTA